MSFPTNTWNIVLVVTSFVLLGYWFRYACLFILRKSANRGYAGKIATANQLNFEAVQAKLARSEGVTEPDLLRELLDRDYRLLCFLIGHGWNFRIAGGSIELWMLHLDFKMMRIFYTLSRRIAISQAHESLYEMAEIIAHLANSMGREASLSASR